MPKGIPLAGKRAKGAGGARENAGRPKSSNRRPITKRMTEEENQAVEALLKQMRYNEGVPSTDA